MDANNTTEQTAIQAAIKYFTDRAPMNCGVMYKKFMQVAAWLGELAAYQDKTYITAEWLVKNGFEFKIGDKDDPDYYLYCDDVVEITAILRNEEAGIWEICIQFLDHGDTDVLDICTLGQFRMFLAICGLDNIAEQFK